MKKLCCVNDMPGVGKIALSAMIPILSAKGREDLSHGNARAVSHDRYTPLWRQAAESSLLLPRCGYHQCVSDRKGGRITALDRNRDDEPRIYCHDKFYARFEYVSQTKYAQPE